MGYQDRNKAIDSIERHQSQSSTLQVHPPTHPHSPTVSPGAQHSLNPLSPEQHCSSTPQRTLLYTLQVDMQPPAPWRPEEQTSSAATRPPKQPSQKPGVSSRRTESVFGDTARGGVGTCGMVQDSRSGTSGLDVGGSALGWNGRETARSEERRVG